MADCVRHTQDTPTRAPPRTRHKTLPQLCSRTGTAGTSSPRSVEGASSVVKSLSSVGLSSVVKTPGATDDPLLRPLDRGRLRATGVADGAAQPASGLP